MCCVCVAVICAEIHHQQLAGPTTASSHRTNKTRGKINERMREVKGKKLTSLHAYEVIIVNEIVSNNSSTYENRDTKPLNVCWMFASIWISFFFSFATRLVTIFVCIHRFCTAVLFNYHCAEPTTNRTKLK